MMPGMPKELKGAKIDDDDLKPVEAIIRSMTPTERAQPADHQRQPRARASPTARARRVGDVNRLVKQFGEMQKMMKKMGMGGGKKGKRRLGDTGHGRTRGQEHARHGRARADDGREPVPTVTGP